MAKYFTVKQDALTGKNIVTIDAAVPATQAEKDIVQMYVATGADIRFKSQKRAETMRKRAKATGFGAKKKNVEATEEKTEAAE